VAGERDPCDAANAVADYEREESSDADIGARTLAPARLRVGGQAI
jgi:hypothetical protein